MEFTFPEGPAGGAKASRKYFSTTTPEGVLARLPDLIAPEAHQSLSVPAQTGSE
jgi:hypothetical protein